MEEVIDASKRRLFDWAELWRFRELFYFFTWRDVKIKYKHTILGVLWAVLQPVLITAILTVFGRSLRIDTHGLPYEVFVFAGLLIWNIFSTGLINASNSIISNSTIIRKIYFPRLVIPVCSILVALFDFVVASILLIPVLIWFGQPVHWDMIWAWPAGILMAVAGTLGPGCWLAALNIKYRDFRYIVPFVVQVLFFVSPVIYPLSLIKVPALQNVLAASPAYGAIQLFRAPLTGDWGDTGFLLISLCSTLALLFLGTAYFKRTEDTFGDLA
jgi:lipopolysaccharide transport system permease protein